jgi:hypothetical protein
MTMKRGTVFVIEDEDFDHFLTGRFRASWGSGEAHEDGPEGVELGAALAWARERSPTVIVCLGDERYSAGETPDREYPMLPAGMKPPSRRRDPAFTYLDRPPSDQPVEWPVELDFHLERGPLGGAAHAFVDAIARHPAVIDLEAEAVGTERTVRAAFRLSARTYTEVDTLADVILQDAMKAAGRATPDGPPSAWYAGHLVRAPATTG